MVRAGPYRAVVRSGSVDGDPVSSLGRLVQLYKYHGREVLERLLGVWVAEAVDAAPWKHRVQAVVAVPTLWRRRVRRPLYPAERLATYVADRIGAPEVAVLKRVRGGSHQIGLNYEERVKNVRGAFAMARGASVRGARLLVVDDVKTTGATVHEVAKVLRKAGAAEVYAAVMVTVAWHGATDTTLPQI
jgi:ComF family protein